LQPEINRLVVRATSASQESVDVVLATTTSQEAVVVSYSLTYLELPETISAFVGDSLGSTIPK